MRIAQISDTHLSVDHPSRTNDLERCIAQVNTLDPQPDMVVHTGDVAHNGLPEEYETARRLLDTLKAPVVVLAGNRDRRAPLIDAFADLGYLPPDASFVQYAIDRFPVRLVCIDTVSTASNKGHMCKHRLDHLAALLDEDPAKPTVVFMHHPPFEVSVGPDPFHFEAESAARALQALIAQHNNIVAARCGHVHRDTTGHIGTVPAAIMSCCANDLRKGETLPVATGTPLYLLHDLEPAISATG
ncbi:MAG: metallophosphoesterase [Hyphomicrobiaceae bacterium]